jgi:hypothetical protein
MEHIHKLSERANINVRSVHGKKVVIYEDHRTILNVLYYLKQEGDLTSPINIILFDNHDDACTPTVEVKKTIRKFKRKVPSLREFWSFTEFDLRHTDDDWIKTGMELELINHVFIFNATESVLPFKTVYKTITSEEKKIYNVGKLWDALSHRGYLYDIIKTGEYGALWEDFGWKYSKEHGRFIFEPDNPYIADFDLDCFSAQIMGERIAIPEEVMAKKFCSYNHPTNHYYRSGTEFIKDVISHAEFSTICFENTFCGGFREAFKIFEIIDRLWFDEQLGGASSIIQSSLLW